MKLAAAVPFQYINYDHKNRPNQYSIITTVINNTKIEQEIELSLTTTIFKSKK